MSAHEWRALISYTLTDDEARKMVQGYGHPEVDGAPVQMLAGDQKPAVGDPRVFLGTHNMLREDTFICCYACELVWTPEVAAAPCAGEPVGDLRYVGPDGAIVADPPPAVGSNLGAHVGTVGRNEPCPCGSGKKFKRCHGA